MFLNSFRSDTPVVCSLAISAWLVLVSVNGVHSKSILGSQPPRSTHNTIRRHVQLSIKNVKDQGFIIIHLTLPKSNSHKV